MYLNGKCCIKSPKVLIFSSFSNSLARFGPTPVRNCMFVSRTEIIAYKYKDILRIFAV